jgi:hypothetical protein
MTANSTLRAVPPPRLDAAEVSAEVERLRAMDLSYPSDPECERERRLYHELLERAATQGRGIVGFYY